MATVPTGQVFGDPAGTDPAIPGIILASYTYNSNIASMYARCNDFLVELLHSNSSNVAQMMPADSARFSARVEAMRNYIVYAVSAPLLDMVKTGQTAKPLDTSPNIVECENQTINEFVGLVRDFRDELSNSQSTRLPNNLMKFDTVRANAMLDKMDTLMSYDAKAEPLDSPASTPDELSVGPGNLGITG